MERIGGIMGIIKDETLPNGMPISYFRIVSLTTVVNQQSIIEVAGYVSQEAREEEQEAIVDPDKGCDVYIDTRFIVVDYDPEMSVNKAYELLKGMEEYEGAEDVWDDWAVSETYYIGDIRKYEDTLYKCRQLHTAQEGWEPPNAPSLWEIYEEEGGIPVWTQPESTNPYMKGDKVHFPTKDDPVYVSTIDYNVYAPNVYGWELEGGE